MINLIIDANALYARAFYAAQHATGRAAPEDVLGILLRSVCQLLLPGPGGRIGARIDRTLCCWDGRQNPLKNRDEKPQQYHELKLIAQDALAFAFGTIHCQHSEFEGDDLVATAVAQADPEEDISYIVSSDKDLQQLAGPHSPFYCLATKAVLSDSFITRKWHVQHPSQVALALAIIGDPVDNIKGVRGWGPAKCRRLFAAVTPEMSPSEALEALASQMPADKAEEFYVSLDRTLLHPDVPGVPAPASLRLADPREVYRLGVSETCGLYGDVFNAY